MTARTQRRFEPGIDRYAFDFRRCPASDGWAQVDTSQDASWFGQWLNPLQLRIVTYAEGDVTIQTADSREDFCAMVREHHAWNIRNGHAFAIDPMCNQRIIDALQALGLGEFMHQQTPLTQETKS